jgi:hypothetical protein
MHAVALGRMVRPASCGCAISACSLHLAPDGAVALICFGCGSVEETEAELLCAEMNAGEATTEILPPVEGALVPGWTAAEQRTYDSYCRDSNWEPPEPPWWPLLGLVVAMFSAAFAIGFCAAILWGLT